MKKPKAHTKKNTQQINPFFDIRTILAGYVIIILLLQLFTFEDFWLVITGLGISDTIAKITSVVLVLAELLAIPFWLRMNTKSWLSKISMWSGIFALVLLTVLEIVGLTAGKVILFGATLTLPSGLWSLVLLFSLWILMAWSLAGVNKNLLAKK